MLLFCILGLLTISPLSNLPGLSILHPSQTHWIDVERTEIEKQLRQTLCQHCIDEKLGLLQDEDNEVDITFHHDDIIPNFSQSCSSCRRPVAATYSTPEASSTVSFFIFPAETLSLLSRGAIRGTIHFVDEPHTMIGKKRISMPFFQRAVQTAVVPCEGLLADKTIKECSIAEFIETEVWFERPWAAVKKTDKQKQLPRNMDF